MGHKDLCGCFRVVLGTEISGTRWTHRQRPDKPWNTTFYPIPPRFYSMYGGFAGWSCRRWLPCSNRFYLTCSLGARTKSAGPNSNIQPEHDQGGMIMGMMMVASFSLLSSFRFESRKDVTR